MATAVPDSSALVSLGVVAGSDLDPLSLFLDTYDVVVPPEVVGELRDVASYDDDHGQGARRVLDRRDALTTRAVALDSAFPLDEGENAAVSLANDTDAALFLCDEFNQLGLIHASLADTRLVTTPTLLSMLVHNDQLSPTAAVALLDDISTARSWSEHSYVQRVRSRFEQG